MNHRQISSRVCAVFGTAPVRIWAITAVALFTIGAVDRKEYDLILTIRAEAVPQQRIAFLDEWAKQYPKSELVQSRLELYLRAYHEVGDHSKMLQVAEEMVRQRPDSFVGVYWSSLLMPASKETSEDRLKRGDAAARQLIKSLDTYFAGNKKPAATSDADWQKQKTDVERLAHRALGWIEWQRGNHGAAEKEFTTCLEKNPKDAEISAWYGTVLTLEKKPEKLPLAFWQMARAASLKEEGGLTDGQRRTINNTLHGLYTTWHGSADGFDKLLADAAGAVNPPADFTVESASSIAQRIADQEFQKAEPERYYWKKLRTQLESAEGEAYFNDSVKGTHLPKLKGWLVSGDPAAKPKSLVVGISDQNAEEVTLKLNAPFPAAGEPGTILFFEGAMATGYSKSPFSLTLEIEKDKIEGWTPKARK